MNLQKMQGFSEVYTKMPEIKFYSGKTIPMEMHKVKIVQKLNLLPARERLAKMEENAKRDLGMLPPKELTAEERIRGKFVEGTKHLKRRKESGRKPLTYAVLLIGIGALCYVLHYLVTGELNF